MEKPSWKDKAMAVALAVATPVLAIGGMKAVNVVGDALAGPKPESRDGCSCCCSEEELDQVEKDAFREYRAYVKNKCADVAWSTPKPGPERSAVIEKCWQENGLGDEYKRLK